MPLPVYQFGPYRVSAERRTVERDGSVLPVPARAFDILAMLLERRHRVVTKDELLAGVWSDQIVEESNLTQQIFVLRRLLGDGRYIATVPRRGYQFIAPVSEVRATVTPTDLGAAVWRLQVVLDPPIVVGTLPALALSRDGRLLVYVGDCDGDTALYLRRMDQYGAHRIAGTEGGVAPFLSPDARWLGFSAQGRLKRVAIDGGTPVAIADVEGLGRGATWGPQNQVVFAPHPAGPLSIVSAAGGTPRLLTRLDYANGDRSHRLPAFSADGRTVLFTIARAGDASFSHARLALADVESGAHRVVIERASGGMQGGAQLFFQRDGMLFTTALDAAAGAARTSEAGDLAEPLEPITTHEAGAAHIGVSDHGLLLCVPPSAASGTSSRLTWGQGPATPLPALAGIPEEPRFSPAATMAVVGVRGETSDLWLIDLTRTTATRLTDAGDNFAAIWTPDGSAVVFSSNREGPSNLYQLDPGAPDRVRRLTTSGCEQVPGAVARDGHVLFTQYDPETGADLWIRDPRGDVRPLLATRFHEYSPALSPDEAWVAYTSDASGIDEVYVAQYPSLRGRQQVSRGGGAEPIWLRTENRLMYRSPHGVVAVAVAADGTLGDPAPPQALPSIPGSHTGLPNYDVHPDGRVLVVAPPVAESTRGHLHAVFGRHAADRRTGDSR